MARVAIPITETSVAGVNQPTATTGNSSENMSLAENDGLILLEAFNENATATATVTIVANREEAGLKIENKVITLAKKGEAGGIQLIRIPAPQVVNQTTPAGQVFVNVSSNEVNFRAYHV
jgi:hypothetical protein